MIGAGTLGALMVAIAAISPAMPMPKATIVHERRKKAQRTLTKAGRAPVPYADADIIEAAEAKRARKAAKAERDLIRTKMGAGK